jgi:ribonuclease HI
VLLNFFRAEAERRKKDRDVPDVIYAIEEPETSQHPEHQKKLIDALIELSKTEHTQIILTTHSPALVKMLNFEHLRLIKSINKIKEISNVDANELPYPSLNEINHVVFSEATEEYHNELYGFIDIKKWLNDYKNGKATVPYQKIMTNGSVTNSQIIQTEYIRHQIHHPENTLNTQYTLEQLHTSIQDMRNFIQNKKTGVNDNEYQSVA